ncbi:DNA alkylation repair protein [Paenisporosarcina antarctica]|uniref:DNA alkylation repair protein n=1 Tax=Paenisporosarcina antarctica TaxID=417367 RepID=A0A4P7A169_9BACL|nr:DNA alkylation repair protein [Paenisporosarcina antarctica]QBP42169.1 DNA alkylation repair protein [Paenisporosarcina antarctica]
MSYEEVMRYLEEVGTEQTRNILINNGATGEIFGVKIGDMKKILKHVKKDQELVLKLYDSGIYDAMYLAGLAVNPKLMTKEQLQSWVEAANWYMLAEYTVPWVTTESQYALELAREWMRSDEEMIVCAGWSTYSNYLAYTSADALDIKEINELLEQVRVGIHEAQNRVRYVMNSFVIGVGVYVSELRGEAKQVAREIGEVHVDMGGTACKVPIASDYIEKVLSRGEPKKKKTLRC